jgi:hypothetical protein
MGNKSNSSFGASMLSLLSESSGDYENLEDYVKFEDFEKFKKEVLEV